MDTAKEDIAAKLEGTKFTADITSKQNIATVMEKIKADRELMPAALKMFNEDQEMNRSLTKAAYEVKRQKDSQGMAESAKKRISKTNEAFAAIQKRDGAMKKGELVCVMVNPNSKRSRMVYSLEEVRGDNYSRSFTQIAGVSFWVISADSCLTEKPNKLATYLLNWEGIECCGPTGFMMLDGNSNPKDVSVERFNELVTREEKTRV